MDDQPATRSAYKALYQLAAQQAGYFTTRQARSVGVSHRQLSYYVKTNHLQRIRSGLYRLVLFPPSPHEDLFVAWLAAGPHAVISHESALALYDLSDVLPAEIHIIVPPTTSRRHQGVRLHTNRMSPDDITSFAGLPVTTVSRTIADVASSGLADELVIQAIFQALQRGLVSKTDLESHVECNGGRMRRLVHQALQEMNT